MARLDLERRESNEQQGQTNGKAPYAQWAQSGVRQKNGPRSHSSPKRLTDADYTPGRKAGPR
ncbi:hypothetical protein CCC_03517 [Paramagnetospirillum magnetotacticum MS-1]|uniref:Uncharacterized protein n=1 Tax=Paramagnetospirillum magnetotacticum MS-1 TaxID=272627 RepID=A0A0C2YHR3_PARME|nr:hypothetical protein CCC_03517 [Paramagnetospirillum magnetotacticum MS-1]